MRTTIAILAGLALFSSAAWSQAGAQPSTKNGEWPYYTADLNGTRYSPLDQINASNFSRLEVAWRFKTDNLGTRPEYKLEGTPLMVAEVRSLVGESKGFDLRALEPFRAEGLHTAMYIVPALAVVLAVVLFLASRTIRKDVATLQAWMAAASDRSVRL